MLWNSEVLIINQWLELGKVDLTVGIAWSSCLVFIVLPMYSWPLRLKLLENIFVHCTSSEYSGDNFSLDKFRYVWFSMTAIWFNCNSVINYALTFKVPLWKFCFLKRYSKSQQEFNMMYIILHLCAVILDGYFIVCSLR